MRIVYNSEQYFIVAYPAEEAYEVIDKTAGRGSYFGGDLAHRFRDSMRDIAVKDPTSESIDQFIADFGLALTLPAVYH